MSRRSPESSYASVFAALGDPTRLAIVKRLSGGRRSSISQLTEGSRLTRQAVTKHLRVLEGAGIVHSRRAGRESVFEFDPGPLHGAQDYLGAVSARWDEALGRLKSFVEE